MSKREERKAARILIVLLGLGLLARIGAIEERLASRVAVTAGPGRDLDTLIARTERMVAPLRPGEQIDIDRAPASDLVRLPGIGPALASRIVAFRDSAGPFGRLQALDAVPGIGPTVLAQVGDFARFSGRPRRTSHQPIALRVNRASAAELEELPGIGPAKARAIIEYRDRRGPFRQARDLLGVPGVGEATLEGLLPHIQIP